MGRGQRRGEGWVVSSFLDLEGAGTWDPNTHKQRQKFKHRRRRFMT